MRLLSRILAVVAASGIWLYIPSSTQAARAEYPVWPSFLSTGCSSLPGGSGSVTVTCGPGAFLLSQINSGYECNNVDISVSRLFSGEFTAIGTVNSGSQSNTVTIDSSADYFMQFPGFLTNNLVTIQITAGASGGSMELFSISSSPCAVPSDTPTINPSSTATNTPIPVTGTPTPIPTHTPLPSGKSTFTASPTGSATATPTATSTAAPTLRNCGDITFPLLNCDFVGGDYTDSNLTGNNAPQALDWTLRAHASPPNAGCGVNSSHGTAVMVALYNMQGTIVQACNQQVTAAATGSLIMVMNHGTNNGGWAIDADTGTSVVPTSVDGCDSQGPSQPVCAYNLGTVTSGHTYTLEFTANAGLGVFANMTIWIDTIYVGSASATPTPGATSTITPTPASTDTVTPIPSDTPIPIPGAMSTDIPTATECPGGCAVAALTAVPGLSTITTVDTSPFSQLQHLSLARNGCTAFGYVQVPYPVIHGTPVLGSTTPLSVTWTLPVTHDWDNTQPFSNTAIEPCAMSEIPTFVWDFTYWLSVFACSVVFIMWLIGVIGRLSGDENING